MVAEGNINYHDILKSSSDISPGVPVRGRDPLRQQKTSVTVFTTLVSRAAMVGGLSPEIAYALGDSYIQNAEDCKDSGELSALANTMYHDFIYRVHYARANPDYSHAVQKCCDYIELNLDQKLSAADLAPLVGYTEYYLTDKFRKETGVSLSSYIRDKKIERAKVLLETTALPISEIADMLAFNTPNYFIQCFRNAQGCTPARYRKKNRTQ
jgi:AraC-like DNA-binding protein